MSLNRYEQLLYDYLQNHPDERRYWEGRVIEIAKRSRRKDEAVNDLNRMFWEYFEERSRFESPFREVILHEGMARISMRNLSEYLIRVLVPPKRRPNRS